MHNRENALNKWLNQVLSTTSFELNPLAGDASFRRYFRLQQGKISQVVMDAPPDRESIQPFLNVGKLLNELGIQTPIIQASDLEQGFAILDDFGDTLLLSKLNSQTADNLYQAAITTLIKMQQASATQLANLPSFDKTFILQELALCKSWFFQSYLGLALSVAEERLIADSFDWLSEQIRQQPQVFIHRDYHSRNIMLLNEEDDRPELGIIDFQDAMSGPYTYDLVSLLKDCYVQWPREQVISWLSCFYQQAGLQQQISLMDFSRDFDFCGLQRHLKVLGVFSRLHLRDNKPNYLQDLPLTLHYVIATLESYEELQPFYHFMQERIRLP